MVRHPVLDRAARLRISHSEKRFLRHSLSSASRCAAVAGHYETALCRCPESAAYVAPPQPICWARSAAERIWPWMIPSITSCKARAGNS